MIAAISIAPSGPASDPTVEADEPGSYHRAVAADVRLIRDSARPNDTTTLYTAIEGEWYEVMAVVKAAVEEAGRYGSRVSLVLKADIRPGHTGELEGKVARVEQHLGDTQ
jgi:uncharacterized protein YqgV (UPF0045/DUF77 family)